MSPAILTIIIFFLCILSFIWEKIPLAVTCLLGGIALALLGIIDYVDIYSNMGTQVVAIVIGTSMVGLGLEDVYKRQALYAAVEQHIVEYGVTEFIVGHYGGFDRLAALAVKEAKRFYLSLIHIYNIANQMPVRFLVAKPRKSGGHK